MMRLFRVDKNQLKDQLDNFIQDVDNNNNILDKIKNKLNKKTEK